MTLDDFLQDSNESGPTPDVADSTEKQTRTDRDISEVTMPRGKWRFFLKETDGFFPVQVLEDMERWELEAVLDFIEEELDSSLPFGVSGRDMDMDKVRENKRFIQDAIEEMEKEEEQTWA